MADIVGGLQEAQEMIELKQEESSVLMQLITEEGAAGIKAYFRIKKEAVSLQARVATARMKLQGFIEVCKRTQRRKHGAKNWTDREEEAISE